MKNVTYRFAFWGVVIAVAAIGCSGDGGASVRRMSYLDLPPEAVLMRVGGRELRKADVESQIDCRIAMIKAANKVLKDTRREVFAARMYRNFFNQFMPKALYLNAAESAGVKASEDDLETVRRELLLAYGGGSVKSIDSFRKRMTPKEFATLQTRIAEDALIFAYWRSRAPEAFVVTDEEYAAIRKRAEDMNARAEKTLAAQRVKAEEIYRKLLAGEDFTKLAEAESATANEDSGGFWGKFEPNEIPYPEIAEVVQKMAPGEVAKPIELDDGIHIVKLVDRNGTKNASVFSPDGESVSLSRIVVRLPIMYAMAPTNEIRRDMRRQKLEPLQKKWLAKLQEGVRVEYPSGTNLWNFLKRRNAAPQPARSSEAEAKPVLGK